MDVFKLQSYKCNTILLKTMIISVVFFIAFALAGSLAFPGGFLQPGGLNQRFQTGGFNPSFGLDLDEFYRFQLLNRQTGNTFQRNRGLQNFQTARLYGVEPDEYFQYNLFNQGGFGNQGLNQYAQYNFLDLN